MILLGSSYHPPLDYFRALLADDSFTIDIFENYQKQSFRNRCIIVGANGLQTLSIPIQRASTSKQLVKDVKIDYSSPWQRVHWLSIKSAYGSSPYFEYYEDMFLDVYKRRDIYLWDLNHQFTALALKLMEIDSRIIYSENYLNSANLNVDYIDYRELIHPKQDPIFETKSGQYNQVFIRKFGFIENLSIIDLLFNEGPHSFNFLKI